MVEGNRRSRRSPFTTWPRRRPADAPWLSAAADDDAVRRRPADRRGGPLLELGLNRTVQPRAVEIRVSPLAGAVVNRNGTGSVHKEQPECLSVAEYVSKTNECRVWHKNQEKH